MIGKKALFLLNVFHANRLHELDVQTPKNFYARAIQQAREVRAEKMIKVMAQLICMPKNLVVYKGKSRKPDVRGKMKMSREGDARGKKRCSCDVLV